MRNINKRRLLICVIISIIFNSFFFFRQLIEFEFFNEQGIVTVLYVKSLEKNESTFFQRVKNSKVAKTYFITAKGDTIYDVRKNIWALEIDALDSLNFYLPLDSIIYSKNNPKYYQLISQYRNYSMTFSFVSYLIIGVCLLTIWFYLIGNIILNQKLKL